MESNIRVILKREYHLLVAEGSRFNKLTRKRSGKGGGELVIVDPRRTESVKRWGGHVPIHPGTDIFLLLALLYELRDLARPNACVSGLDELLKVAAEYSAERAARLTRIPLERIRVLAASMRKNGVVPFAMKCIFEQMQCSKFFIGDFPASRMALAVASAL